VCASEAPAPGGEWPSLMLRTDAPRARRLSEVAAAATVCVCVAHDAEECVAWRERAERRGADHGVGVMRARARRAPPAQLVCIQIRAGRDFPSRCAHLRARAGTRTRRWAARESARRE
jgi:hypothetical protein